MTKTHEERIEDLLEKILRVLSLQVSMGRSISEAARLLKSAGLDNKTIANVLGTTDATIRSVTARKLTI